jgi:hypothetical protein
MGRSLIVMLLIAAAALAIGYGLRMRGEDPHDRPTAKAVALPQTPVSAGEPSIPPAPVPAPRMDRQEFWRLMADARADSDNDTGRQSELLEQRVADLPSAQADEFKRIRHALDEGAYRWDIWGAAYVIEDGCSDDCFRDFRAYLISLGKGPYEAALRDPDSLAPVVQDAERGDWENADNPADDDDADLSGNPRGEPWDDEHAEELVQRYPRLAERFR